MRKKASSKTPSFRDTRRNDHKVSKPILKPTRTPTGKGLGKAGAKRLGRLLKRVIHGAINRPGEKEEPAMKGKLTLPSEWLTANGYRYTTFIRIKKKNSVTCN